MSEEIQYPPQDACPSCEKGTLEQTTIDYDLSLLPTQWCGKASHIIENLPCRQCDECGELIFDRDACRRIELEVVEAQGSLLPEQVERLVAMTGMGEAELSNGLGLGAKTIYRWRIGAIRPSKSLALLLSIVAHHPHLLEWIDKGEWRHV